MHSRVFLVALWLVVSVVMVVANWALSPWLTISRGYFSAGQDVGLVRFYAALLSQAAVPTDLAHAVSLSVVMLVLVAAVLGSPSTRGILHYSVAALILPVLPIWRSPYSLTVATTAIVIIVLALYYLGRAHAERQVMLLWLITPVVVAAALDSQGAVHAVVKYVVDSPLPLWATILRTLSGALVVLPMVIMSLLRLESGKGVSRTDRSSSRGSKEKLRLRITLMLLAVGVALVSPWLAYALPPVLVNRHPLALVSLSVLLMYFIVHVMNPNLRHEQTAVILPYVALGCLWNPTNAPFETATAVLFALVGAVSCLLWARVRGPVNTLILAVSFCLSGVAFYFATGMYVPWAINATSGFPGWTGWGFTSGVRAALASWPQVLAVLFPQLMIAVLPSTGFAENALTLRHYEGVADEV